MSADFYGDAPIRYLEQTPQRLRDRVAELERQRDELLAAVQKAVAFCEARGGRWGEFEADMRAAIAKAKP